jgi:hypothetical protein
MFLRSFASKDRAGKPNKITKRSFRDNVKQKMLETTLADSPMNECVSPPLTSAIITLVVGEDQRLFAAHEDVLCHSPFFAMACKDQFFETNSRRIALPDEEPEVFSCILEYLYKGDYYPRLMHDKRRNTWFLEGAEPTTPDLKAGGRAGGVEATIYHPGVGDVILRDTAVYCAADRYGLEELTASRSAPSCAARGTPTSTRRTATRACALITWPSLSEAAGPSSAAAPCSWRWRLAANCSLTSSWRCATTWMISSISTPKVPREPSKRVAQPAPNERQDDARKKRKAHKKKAQFGPRFSFFLATTAQHTPSLCKRLP